MTEFIKPSEIFQLKKRPRQSPWSNAKKTDVDGIRFDSKTEARVYQRLLLEAAEIPGTQVFRQVRWPLLTIDAKGDHQPHTIRVDFCVRYPDGRLRHVEAKCPGRVSRDWPLRAAAFRAQYGPLEEVSK